MNVSARKLFSFLGFVSDKAPVAPSNSERTTSTVPGLAPIRNPKALPNSINTSSAVPVVEGQLSLWASGLPKRVGAKIIWGPNIGPSSTTFGYGSNLRGISCGFDSESGDEFLWSAFVSVGFCAEAIRTINNTYGRSPEWRALP